MIVRHGNNQQFLGECLNVIIMVDDEQVCLLGKVESTSTKEINEIKCIREGEQLADAITHSLFILTLHLYVLFPQHV